MLDHLPMKVLEYLYDFIETPKVSWDFALVNSKTYESYKNYMQKKIQEFLEDSSHFYKLLDCVISDQIVGLAILKDPDCKAILINKRAKELPHWIINIPECQPGLSTFLLLDNDYRNSLTRDEYEYLLNNYPDLKAFAMERQLSTPTAKEYISESKNKLTY
jgi:hypothetical protein